ncbi:ImmA/IrrE family metallo-endopeptidase [Candidatus Bipolaricaulota bacterium]|nr:ImmA/IrrE family metallo-endopeptidase [Candidatus Bipolaricaulota bacterium]
MTETARRNPERVPLHPDALVWAMDRARATHQTLAKGVGVHPERVQAWLRGEEWPTYRQGWSLALRLHVPLSNLLLPPPSEESLPIQDFRRRGKGEPPSPELLEAVYDAKRKQAWWREWKKAPLPFVGSASRGGSPDRVAKAIQSVIRVQQLQGAAGNWQDFLRRLAVETERAGVLVLRQGYVGTNTRRSYDPREFSGFALLDAAAPVVFVNAKDPVARQAFTIGHELAHIWLGQEGVDGPFETEDEEDLEEVERYADQVAASLLMPEEDFLKTWQGHDDAYKAAQGAARRFKVSAWAALRRALDLNLVSPAGYREALEAVKKATQEARGREVRADFWATLAVHNSPTFTRVLCEAAREGEVDFKEAASLLSVRLSTFMVFFERGKGAGVPD